METFRQCECRIFFVLVGETTSSAHIRGSIRRHSSFRLMNNWIYVLCLCFAQSVFGNKRAALLNCSVSQIQQSCVLAWMALTVAWGWRVWWLTASVFCPQARLNCKHCGKPVIDVRIGMQYFSEYSNVQQCPHCGNLDYHFVKPFSSFKVLEAYWWKLCFSNSYFIDIITLLHIFYRETFCDINFFSNLKESSFAYVCH